MTEAENDAELLLLMVRVEAIDGWRYDCENDGFLDAVEEVDTLETVLVTDGWTGRDEGGAARFDREGSPALSANVLRFGTGSCSVQGVSEVRGEQKGAERTVVQVVLSRPIPGVGCSSCHL